MSSSAPPQSILLLGAGELGTALLAQISTHPGLSHTRLTVVLRPASLANPARLDALRAIHPALSFAALDLGERDAQARLTRLIRAGRHDAVIACTGMATSGTGAGTQLLVARAVLDAGGDAARRFFPWQWGVDYDVIGADAAAGLMREQCGVRALLRAEARARGVAWTIVSTGVFMSFLFEEAFGVVEGLGTALRVGGPEPLADGEGVVVRALGRWANGVSVTDVADIGKVVASLLVEPVESDGDEGGSVVFVAGDTVTYGGLAEVVQKVVGRRAVVKKEEWGLGFLKAELEKEPESQIKKYRMLFAEGKGVRWDKEKTINAQRGLELKGVEQWLREKLSM